MNLNFLDAAIERARRPWWSFAPGPAYVAATGSQFRPLGGPGLFAHSAPGTFNLFALLFHLKEPHDHSFDDYFEAVPMIMLMSALGAIEFDGLCVDDQAMMLDPLPFLDWLEPHIPAWQAGTKLAGPGLAGLDSYRSVIERMRASPIALRARLGVNP